jgi:hypothetical protein
LVEKAIDAFFRFLILYVLFPEITALLFIFAIFTGNIIWMLIAVFYAIVLAYVLTSKVHYDAERLEGIYIEEEAPPFINKLLSETTNRGVLINQLIIKIVAENPLISQTKLYEKIKQSIGSRNCPVKEMIRRYLRELENADIIKDMSHNTAQSKEKAYVLTKRGKWCLDAIRKYYPNYLIIYLVRCILRTRFRKELPSFESRGEKSEGLFV